MRSLAAAAAAALLLSAALSPGTTAQQPDTDDNGDEGIPVTDQTVIDACQRCHSVDDDGLMSRVSFMRKTPEGWQQSIRRMVTLNEAELDPETARAIVRYLSDDHGIAPEELRPGRFEVERRLIDWTYEPDEDVENTCSQCHSMGRVITQRRTREEWKLLMAMHRGYYPLSDTQGFRRFGPPRPGATDSRHPMDKAVAHLSGAFPLKTDEWTSWSATMRPPRVAGTWALKGYELGMGPLYGTVEIAAGGATSFTSTVRYTYARTGEEVERSGRSIGTRGISGRAVVRGRGDENELREVMMVERGWGGSTDLVRGGVRRVRSRCDAAARGWAGAAWPASRVAEVGDERDGDGAWGEHGGWVGGGGCGLWAGGGGGAPWSRKAIEHCCQG